MLKAFEQFMNLNRFFQNHQTMQNIIALESLEVPRSENLSQMNF